MGKAGKKKTAGEVIACIVWIIGAVFFGVYAVSRFTAIGSAVEDTADCIRSGINYTLYLLAYVSGILYLLFRNGKKTVWIMSLLYIAAYGFGLLFELMYGGRLSMPDLTTKILLLAGYAVFAVFAGILAGEPGNGAFSWCRKFWYLPAVFLLLAGLTGNVWVELVRPDGFLWDGFLLDTAASLLTAIPVFAMLLVIHQRTSE